MDLGPFGLNVSALNSNVISKVSRQLEVRTKTGDLVAQLLGKLCGNCPSFCRLQVLGLQPDLLVKSFEQS